MDDTYEPKKQDAGAPAWVMTFADLMSLLMCFFVLLLSFSEMEALKFKQIAGSMREAFGVQNQVKVKEPPKGTSLIAREFSPGRPLPTPLNEVRQFTTETLRRNLEVPDSESTSIRADVQRAPTPDLNPNKEGGLDTNTGMPETQPGRSGAEAQAAAVLQARAAAMLAEAEAKLAMADRKMAEAQAAAASGAEGGRDKPRTDQPDAAILQEVARIKQVLKSEIDRELIEVLADGKKIVIRIREKGSFPSGNADLIEPFYPIILKMSEILERSSGNFVVAGHSDNVPISTPRYRSNWDLSAARAASVAHEILAVSTIDPDRFRIEGYADTRPVTSNADASGRALNRRVEVIIVKGNDTEGRPISILGKNPAR